MLLEICMRFLKYSLTDFFNDKSVSTISQKLRSTNPIEIIASDYEKKYELKKS